MSAIDIYVRNRFEIPECPSEVWRKLCSRFEYENPEIEKRKRMKFSTYGVPNKIITWRGERPTLSLPRGGSDAIRTVLADLGYRPRWHDGRAKLPEVVFPQFRVELYPYQQEAVAKCLAREQGIVRAPTGGGKTTMALAFVAAAKQPALVVMRDRHLLEQWRDVAVRHLGLERAEIGWLQGGKRTIGHRLTLALTQTLGSKSFPLDELVGHIGTLVVDEAQDIAARTFQYTLDAFPARYRIGFSADETRNDKLECLVYDVMGKVIFQIERKVLEDRDTIVPVDIHVVPTTFYDAAWAAGDRKSTRMQRAISEDAERNELVVQVVRRLLAMGQGPVFVFTRLREHAKELADRRFFDAGIRCGLLLGGEEDSDRFMEDRARLTRGDVVVACGTYGAIGRGIDIPHVCSAVMAGPIGDNRQFFGQVRGRVCRKSPGKRVGNLVYLWDESSFPRQFKRIQAWSDARDYVKVVEAERLCG